jgi:hypothetical protein
MIFKWPAEMLSFVVIGGQLTNLAIPQRARVLRGESFDEFSASRVRIQSCNRSER